MNAGRPAEPGRPLEWQLDDQARVIDLRPPSGGERPGAPAVPCPVFLARERDPEVDALRAGLWRLGVPSLRAGLGTPVRLTSDGVQFDGVIPTVLWVRHLSPRSAPEHPVTAVRRYRSDAWRALLSQVEAVTGAPVLGTGPGLLRQLAAARALGVRVPETVITTQPGTDVALLRSPRVVAKALDSHAVEAAPGLLANAFAQVADRDEVLRWPRQAPLVLQEYVPHECELRVYHLGGEIHGFRVVKSAPEALWLDERAVRVRSCRVPEPVASATLRLADVLGLGYAAFDFLLSRGEPVFLEANVTGDWRWFERKAATRTITRAAVRMLAGLHCAAGGGRVVPMSFLTAMSGL
ncbi:RimK family alpha-L-glutamate ligase [Planotetraspora sp. GP83]|uniref:ATP-grasp domain-containing protein n=1 Tax=Planotetraspora sp. GP83 TaxID=3156264 RepID=UPI003516AC1E